MSRPWKVDARCGLSSVGILEDAGLGGAAEDLRGRHEEAVVRPDEDVAAGDPDGDRQASRPDTRVHDRDVDPDRQPRHRRPEEVGALEDRELPDAVADVDDLGVRGDREHHAATDRRGEIRPEVGEEADDRSVHGPRS